MRLIGNLASEHQTKIFCSFLKQNGIPSRYEPFLDEESKKPLFHVWVENEEDHLVAFEHFENFKLNPSEYESQVVMQFTAKPFHAPIRKIKSNFAIHAIIKKTSFPLTIFIITLCTLLFGAGIFSATKAAEKKGKAALEIGDFPIQKELMFDYPSSLEAIGSLLNQYPLDSLDNLSQQPVSVQLLYRRAMAIPYWQGLYPYLATKGSTNLNTPMFEKIQEGEVWRLFTPALLHSGLLHILFNMIWVWVLCRQMEERLSIGKMVLFILITAITSNVAQYLMSGFSFVGFSGVIAAMVGFIYVRQKVAPWEGYPLEKPMILFIFYFCVLILALQIALFVAQVFFGTQFNIMIANTAHIVGALTGMALAKLPFFAMRKS